ncbi:MAG: thioesterase domain-containing protein [Alphaproteobacteria bacterium]|nr:thioesterase domain-containing protein [Alphaproteobacteria bacterium]
MTAHQGPRDDGAAGARGDPVQRADFDGLAEYVAPATEAQEAVAEIWRRAFNIDEVGIDDDFFDLQGDSLVAVTIATALSADFEVDFQPSLMITYATVAAIAEFVDGVEGSQGSDASSPSLPSHLVPVRAKGNLAPVFLVHGLFGIFFPNRDFLDALDPEQPVYFLQAIGFMGEAEPPGTVEEIAATYVRAVRLCQPHGPLNIAAFCAGSLIGVEMGHQLRAAGDPPNPLVLIDPPMPYSLKRSPWPLWVRMTFRRVRDFPKWFLRATLGRAGLLGAGGAPDADFKKRLNRLPGAVEGGEKFGTPAAKKAHDSLEYAITIYHPRPYEGRVEVITSRERFGLYEDENLPWPRLLSDFTVHVGVENHAAMFTGEIASMARILQKCLATGG